MAWTPATLPTETDHVAAERTRRPVPERRRPARDVCPPRPLRPEPHDLPDAVQRRPDGVTLDDVLSSAWEALSRHESAPCPVCGEAMRPRYGTGPVPTGGRCSGCATVLA